MSSVNVVFLMMVVLGPILSISSSSWLLFWVGIEISFVGFLPMLLWNSNSSVVNESGMKYFCIQALASALLLISGLMVSESSSLLMGCIFILAVCIKLGAFPGHFWVLGIMSGVDYWSCFLMLGLMKLAPFLCLRMFVENNPEFTSTLMLLGGLSAIVGGYLGNNISNTTSMLGASSISHSGWLILASSFGSFWGYFLAYMSFLLVLCYFLYIHEYYFSTFILLTMSGIPPFFMFLLKMSVVMDVSSSSSSIYYLVFPISGAILSLIFYLKFSYSFYFNSFNTNTSALLLLSFIATNFIGVLLVSIFIYFWWLIYSRKIFNLFKE